MLPLLSCIGEQQPSNIISCLTHVLPLPPPPFPLPPLPLQAVPAENIFRRNLDLDITRDPFRTELETRRHLALTGRGPSSVRVPLVAPVVFSPKPPSNRITMTLSLLNASNNVSGARAWRS